jgi:hypothetical protein
MKVLNLRCTHGHLFEGWFGSEVDFADQSARGLIECPMCADKTVTRMPSAPRLNLSNARDAHGAESVTPPVGTVPSVAPPRANEATLQATFLAAIREVLAKTEDVGDRFPEEARRIHHGEVPARGIRGVATPEERAELADEGIEVAPLPLPASWKGSAH